MTVVLKEKRWNEEWSSIPFHLNISTRILDFDACKVEDSTGE